MRSKEDGKAKAALLMVVFAQAQAYMPPGSSVQTSRFVDPCVVTTPTNIYQRSIFPRG
jgi:hypothetical protein